MAYQSISSAARKGRQPQPAPVEEEKKGGGAGGFFGLGFGPDVNLGGTTLVKELAGMVPGLVALGTAWAPGGLAAGEVYSRAGKGLLSSAAGTVSTIIPGSKYALKPITRNLLGEQYESKDFMEKAGERGILPALVEDVGNLALGAGAAGKVLQVGGKAGRAASATRAGAQATRAGHSAEAIARAAQAGREAGAVGGRVGRIGRIAEAGGPAGRGFATNRGLAQRQRGSLGRVARTEALAEAAGPATNAARVAKLTERLRVMEGVAHPYETVFRGAIRPLTRAAQASEVARAAATATEAAGDVAPPLGPMDDLADVAARADDHAETLRARADEGYGEAAADADLTRGHIIAELGEEGADAAIAAARARRASAADEAAEGADDVNGGLTDPDAERIAPRIGPREEAQRALRDAPIPGWAGRAVAGEGRAGAVVGRMEKPLARTEAFIEGHMSKRVMREHARFAEADRRAVLRSPAMTTAREAAQLLVDEVDDLGNRIDPLTAEGMVFDAISRKLDQTALLEEAARLGARVDEGHPLALKIAEKTGQQFAVPKKFLADETFRNLVEESTEGWKTLAKEREAKLRGSRLGDQGLEAANETDAMLSPAQMKEFRRIQSEYRRISRRVQPLAEKEAEVVARNLVEANDEISRLGAQVASQTAEVGTHRARVRDLARPSSLQEANRPAAWKLISDQVAKMNGALFDQHTGRLLRPAKYAADAAERATSLDGYVVAVKGRFASLDEWTADPGRVLDEFAQENDAVLAHADTRIQVSIVGDKVQLDVAQTTLGGQPLSRAQAVILAQARGEGTVSSMTGNDIPVPVDPASMAYAAHHVAALHNPRSQLNRSLSQWDETYNRLKEWDEELAGSATPDGDRTQMGPFLAERDLERQMQVHMRFAVGMKNSGRIKDVDEWFGMFDQEAKASASRTPVDALLQTYLAEAFNPESQLSMRLLKDVQKFLGPDFEKAMTWYDQGNKTVMSRWGDRTTQVWDSRTNAPKDVRVSDMVFSILAITSVNASPISNMATTMAALTGLADYQRATGWLDEISGAFDEYLDVRERVHPAGVPSSPGAKAALKRTQLYTRLAKTIPHMDNVRDDVMEILSGRMLDEWDNDYLSQRFQRPSLTREAIANKFDRAGTPALKEATKRAADARKAVDAATAKLAEAATDKGRATWQGKLDAANAELTQAVKAESDLGPKVRARIDAMGEQELMELEGSSAYAKMRSFYDNLRNPEVSDGATLDRVMGDLLGLQGGAWQSREVYRRGAVALRDLAAKASIAWFGEPGKVRAHHLQAMLWVYTKRLTNEHDLGRLYAAGLDTIDAVTPENLELFRTGADPITRYLQSDIEHFETTKGITARKVPAVEMPRHKEGVPSLTGAAGLDPDALAALRKKGKRIEQEQFSFFQPADIAKVKEQLEASRAAATKGQAASGTPGTAKTWGAVREDIVRHLENDDVPAAQDRALAWMRDQASRYSMEAEYFEDFFSRDPSKLQPGFKPHGPKSAAADLLNRLRRHGLIDPDPDGTSPSPLFQKFGDEVALGATFMNTTTGRLTMQFFKTADPTTLMHENAHLLRMLLPESDVGVLVKAYSTPATGRAARRNQLAAQAKFTEDVTGRQGPTAWEERFADDMIRHMATGRAPVGLEGVFSRVQEALRGWWGGITGKHAEAIDPSVAELLDRYLAPETGDVPDLPQLQLDLSSKTANQIAANLPARPGETATAARNRSYQAARAAEKARNAEAKAAATTRRVQQVQKTKAELEEQLLYGSGERATGFRRDLTRADRDMERLLGKVDSPTIDRVPGQWKPLWGAVEGLLKEAEGNQALADALVDLPKTFPELVHYATQRGWDPTHVASLSDDKVRRLAFEPLRVGTSEMQAGTRKVRTKAFAESRTLGALAAAQADVIVEQNTNAVVSYIQDVVARPLAEGQQIPPGWVEWSPADAFVKVATDPRSGVRTSTGAGRAQYMIPAHVNKVLTGYTKNFDHASFSFLRKVTNPWRTLVLTWTPRWYMNNVLGNMIMSTKAGVSVDDWAMAWKEYRRGDPVGRNRVTRRFGRGSQAFQGEVGTVTENVGEAIGPGLVDDQLGGASRLVQRQGKNVLADMRNAADEARAAGGGRLKRTFARHDVAAQTAAKANSVVDDLARAAVYISQKRKGYSPEQALQMSYEALVDYGDLGPLERSMVRAVVPFYSWQKGILRQIARFPSDHPVAASIAIQLGQLNEDLHEGLPEMYQSLVDLPGLGNVNLRSINPFQDAEALITPQGIAESMNPFAGAMARNAFGAPASGFPEHQRIDKMGRVMPTTNPTEDFTQIALGLPQVSVAGALTGKEAVAGRAVGDNPLLRFAGIPTVSADKVEQVRERLTKAEQRLASFNAGKARRAELAGQPEPVGAGADKRRTSPYASVARGGG